MAHQIEVDWHHGDCRDILPTIPTASIDCVITDPPYPEISRDYGRMSEADWFDMMKTVVPECRRVLKPKGSAVFILQPNSKRIGEMRSWLFDFQSWVCRSWNMVQDAYWWNIIAMPEAHSIQGKLMRPSIKHCVWLGDPGCYRDQDSVLWEESELTTARARTDRARTDGGYRSESPGGQGIHVVKRYDSAERRGGVTPFNVIPVRHEMSQRTPGAKGHPAGTPLALCDWWTRYLCPPRGIVLDPFMGSGTTGRAAIRRGCSFVGIEKMKKYHDLAASVLSVEILSHTAGAS